MMNTTGSTWLLLIINPWTLCILKFTRVLGTRDVKSNLHWARIYISALSGRARVGNTGGRHIYFPRLMNVLVHVRLCGFACSHVYPFTHCRGYVHSHPIMPREHPQIKHTHTSYIFPLSLIVPLYFPRSVNSSSLCLSLCTHTCACFAFAFEHFYTRGR